MTEAKARTRGISPGRRAPAQGPANSLRYYWAANGSSKWQPQTVAGAGTTYSAPAIASNGGGANVAAEGPKNSLDFYWQPGGTTQWNPETAGGAGTAYSAPAIVGNQGYGNIAVEGPGHTLSFYWQKNSDLVWNLRVVPGEADYQTPAIIAATFDQQDEACIVVGPVLNCAMNGGGTWGDPSA